MKTTPRVADQAQKWSLLIRVFLLAGILFTIASVALSPASSLFPGPPAGLADALRGRHSAWSDRGEPLPFDPMPFSLASVWGLITGKRWVCSSRLYEQTRLPLR